MSGYYEAYASDRDVPGYPPEEADEEPDPEAEVLGDPAAGEVTETEAPF